jgi:L-ascorbate metabolism protein UlaG (beta-lactamase superfamily)
MNTNTVSLTLIDGPTLLIEFSGLRILTDPTFDEPQVFHSSGATERKLNSPPMSADALLSIDAILLSHDQHLDNLVLPVARFCRRPKGNVNGRRGRTPARKYRRTRATVEHGDATA